MLRHRSLPSAGKDLLWNVVQYTSGGRCPPTSPNPNSPNPTCRIPLRRFSLRRIPLCRIPIIYMQQQGHAAGACSGGSRSMSINNKGVWCSRNNANYGQPKIIRCSYTVSFSTDFISPFMHACHQCLSLKFFLQLSTFYTSLSELSPGHGTFLNKHGVSAL